MPKIFDEPETITTRNITIKPITRLEGHGKIDIFLNDQGNVRDAYFQVVELRGFERFCIGRPVEELPRITPRICGVCPGPHHMASTKATDAVFGAEVPEPAKKLRELYYMAHIIHSHIAHFYVLAAPDFILGPAEDPSKRNIVGVIEAVGKDTVNDVITHRAYAQKIQEIIGGRATHSVCGLPGGMSKAISEEERKEIETMARSCVNFSRRSIQIFEDLVLGNDTYVDIIKGDIYKNQTYYMGLVDEENRLNLYDGKIRVVDQKGNEFTKFEAKDYLEHIAEHVEPWTYLKFPYLKAIGWKGLIDGQESGVYRVGPLARLNVADEIPTPLAQEEYEKMIEILGGKPVHATLAYHWARLIELLYASERLHELSVDPEITSNDIRGKLGEPSEGVGVIEAPRGTLFHHYITDESGIVKEINLIVATGNNNAAICISVKKAAESLIRDWKVSNGLLNMIEMAFRAYDPCFACATHALGRIPLDVRIYDNEKRLFKRLTNF
ncbi:MAG: Ni/Fe hydrogenase subunit alpha [Candidatus Hydrothermarchaeota archaeon]